MARTAITVSTISPFLVGGNPSATTGDATNDHSIDMTSVPRLVLIAVNSNAATVDFTVEIAANAATYNIAQSISHTVPAAAAGIDGVRVIPIDSPSAAQTGNVLHVDSADANFGDVRFYAVTWSPTPR